jgi:hypothetical protein
MIIDIYQVTEDAPHGFAFRPHPEQSWKDRQDHYRLAGRVEAEDLSSAYKRTQHVEEDWTQDVEHSRDKARSTAVGDVLITEGGKAFEVGRYGFNPIDIL